MKQRAIHVDEVWTVFRDFAHKAYGSEYVSKPISWALYQTWLWADKIEKERGEIE